MYQTFTDFRRLLSGDDQYVSPTFQRSSRWNKGHYATLFASIREIAANVTRSRADGQLVLGQDFKRPFTTFLIQKTAGCGSLEIGDGQQRFTWASVSLAALFKTAKDLEKSLTFVSNSTDADKLNALCLRIFSTNPLRPISYLTIHEAQSKAPAPRLRLSKFDAVAYDNVLKTGGKPLLSANNLIYETFAFSVESFAKEINGMSFADQVDYLERLELAFLEGYMLPVFWYGIHEDMLRDYIAQNGGGVPLTEAELVKGQLLHPFSSDDRDTYAEAWSFLEDDWAKTACNKNRGPFDRASDALYYVICFICASSEGILKNSPQGVFSAYKKKLTSEKINKEMFQSIKRGTELYRFLVEGVSTKVPSSRRRLRLRDTYSRVGIAAKFTPIMSVLVSLDQHVVSDKILEECLVVIEAYAIRKALSDNPLVNLHETLLPKISKTTTAAQLLSVLGSTMETDASLRSSLKNRIFKRNEHLLLVSIFIDIENSRRALAHNTPIPLRSLMGKKTAAITLSLEHVMPQTPSPWIRSNKYDALVGNLGNFLVLPVGVNTKLSNKSFAEKKKLIMSPIYTSQLFSTAVRAVSTNNVWDKNVIAANNTYMLGLILEQYKV